MRRETRIQTASIVVSRTFTRPTLRVGEKYIPLWTKIINTSGVSFDFLKNFLVLFTKFYIKHHCLNVTIPPKIYWMRLFEWEYQTSTVQISYMMWILYLTNDIGHWHNPLRLMLPENSFCVADNASVKGS